MFDEIPERVYIIQCEGYFDKNGNRLDDETTIKNLASGEHKYCVDDEYYDENGDIDFRDYDNCLSMNHNKYNLRKITKKIKSKKFICEALIGSGESTETHKWISSHKTEKFMVNIIEKFYTKLFDMDVKSIRLCVNDNAFKEFRKAIHNEANIIITTYNTASKCLGDLFEEYYMKEQRLDYFIVNDDAHMLL